MHTSYLKYLSRCTFCVVHTIEQRHANDIVIRSPHAYFIEYRQAESLPPRLCLQRAHIMCDYIRLLKGSAGYTLQMAERKAAAIDTWLLHGNMGGTILCIFTNNIPTHEFAHAKAITRLLELVSCRYNSCIPLMLNILISSARAASSRNRIQRMWRQTEINAESI